MNTRLAGIAVLLIAVFAFAFVGSDEADAASKYSYEVIAISEDFLSDEAFKDRHYSFVIVSEGRANVAVIDIRGFAIANYSVPVKQSKSRLRANFGKFGRISLKVRKPSKWRKGFRNSGCTGNAGAYREVQFRGSIRFRGEGGYHRLKLNGRREAFGEQFRNRTLTCPPDEFEAIDPDQGLVALRAVSGNNSVIAVREPYQYGESLIYLSQSARVGKVDTVKTALVEDGAGQATFDFADDLTGASISTGVAKNALRGSAGFVRTGPDSGTWLGNLSAALPGIGRVKFAGPTFEADLGPAFDILGGSLAYPLPFDAGREPARAAFEPSPALLSILNGAAR